MTRLHPAFTPDAALKAQYRALLGRINHVMSLHSSAWRLYRIKRLRGWLTRVIKTQDRRLIAQWLWEYTAAIHSECRFLEDCAQPVNVAEAA
jgi:hypothetical protein